MHASILCHNKFLKLQSSILFTIGLTTGVISAWRTVYRLIIATCPSHSTSVGMPTSATINGMNNRSAFKLIARLPTSPSTRTTTALTVAIYAALTVVLIRKVLNPLQSLVCHFVLFYEYSSVIIGRNSTNVHEKKTQCELPAFP